MSPADARAALVLAECHRDWDTVKAHLQRARQATPCDGTAQAALAALSLDHAYQAFETILMRIERALALPDRFRHFLRHAYVLDLDGDKLAQNVLRLDKAVCATDGWLTAVLDVLGAVHADGG